jgi:hypothetical protein
MRINESPSNYWSYYKSWQKANDLKRNAGERELERLTKKVIVEREEIKSNLDLYKERYKLNLMDYPEFVDRKHTTGALYRTAKTLFMNRAENHELVAELYDLFVFTKHLKRIAELPAELSFYDRCLALSVKAYRDILKAYYLEVQKKLILEAGGYRFSHDIGLVAIHRVKVTNPHKKLNYGATMLKKRQMIAEGRHLWNKEEAEWCEKNHLPYNGEDYRVFLDAPFVYKLTLYDCRLPNGRLVRFRHANSTPRKFQNISPEDLAQHFDNSLEKICESELCFRQKILVCDKADPTMYAKFIRK